MYQKWEIKNYEIKPLMRTLKKANLHLGLKEGRQWVSILIIKKESIQNNNLFLEYFKRLCQDKIGIYPQYKQFIQSNNNIYIIFEECQMPNFMTCQDWQQLIVQMQVISKNVKDAIFMQELFVTKNQTKLVYIPSFDQESKQNGSKVNNQNNSNQFANIFLQLVPNISEPAQLKKTFIEKFSRTELSQHLKKYLGKLQLTEEEQYDKQIQFLISKVHLNSLLKKDAKKQSMTNSQHNNNKSEQIKVDVEKSILDFKSQVSISSKSSIYKSILKLDKMQFQVSYKHYVSIFKFFKKVIKSYLHYYKNGFSGVVASYFITLIGVLRRIELARDLQKKNKIFKIDQQITIDINKQSKILQEQAKKQSIKMIKLKNSFENKIPQRDSEIINKYFNQNINEINRSQLEKYCFHYLNLLRGRSKDTNYHQVLVIQVMYIIIHHNYQIVHFQEQMPSNYDQKFIQNRKMMMMTQI